MHDPYLGIHSKKPTGDGERQTVVLLAKHTNTDMHHTIKVGEMDRRTDEVALSTKVLDQTPMCVLKVLDQTPMCVLKVLDQTPMCVLEVLDQTPMCVLDTTRRKHDPWQCRMSSGHRSTDAGGVGG